MSDEAFCRDAAAAPVPVAAVSGHLRRRHRRARRRGRDPARPRDPARGVSGPHGSDAVAPRGPRLGPARARRHARADPAPRARAPSRPACSRRRWRSCATRAWRLATRGADDPALLGRGARVGRVRRVLAAHGRASSRPPACRRASITRTIITTGASRSPPASESSRTHSGRLGACLVQLLDAPGGQGAFERVEARVLDIRLRFYDQFTRSA